jgi:hypothetical protein
MRGRLFQILVAAVLGYAYGITEAYLTARAVAFPEPRWWTPLFPSRIGAVVTWLAAIHTIAIVLLSLPFAYLIRRFYRAYATPVALVISLTVLVWTELPALRSTWSGLPYHARLLSSFDAVKVLGVLPLLTFLMAGLPSNKRLERPVMRCRYAP